MAQAWVFGSAPKAVLAPENIFERVASWVWTSRPITVSHAMRAAALIAGGTVV
jgi:hypothetical protein